jgi:serine/threonine protein kinase
VALRRIGGDGRGDEELESLCALAHPALARQLGWSRDGDSLLIVEEWLEGESLEGRAPRALAGAVALVARVLSGLEPLHALGLVHGAIAPGKLIATADGVKLVDLAGPRPRPAPRLPCFLAPEQVHGEAAPEARTDLYALGALLYWLVTGELPFAGDRHSVLRQILSSTPRLPSIVRVELPVWIDEVVLRAMMRSPADRYPSAQAMRADLEARAATASSTPVEVEPPARAGAATVRRTTESASLVGQTVGEYRITERIGAGGMGTVFAGEHPLIGKRVAIKVLRADPSLREEAEGRFLAEARAVNTISHPNIVDIFSFGELDDGRLYFAMEYLDGRSLADYLEEQRTLARPVARRILSQILAALEQVHARGIVHRDLKPENIMLTRGPEDELFVKLLDFGVAKFAEGELQAARTGTGLSIGTPHYMSPEQCEGDPVDARSDIYSLGVLLYRIFTGVLPFDGRSVLAIADAHLRARPRPPGELVALPEGLEAVILACLEKDPARRPAGIAALREQLLPALDDERPLRRRARRWLARLALALAAAAAATGGALLVLRAPAGVAPGSRPPGATAPRSSGAAGPDAAPATVKIHLELTPPGPAAGAEIQVDGVRQAGPHLALPRGTRPVTIEVRAPRHRPFRLRTVPSADQRIEVVLEPEPAAPARRRPAERKPPAPRPEPKEDLTTVL